MIGHGAVRRLVEPLEVVCRSVRRHAKGHLGRKHVPCKAAALQLLHVQALNVHLLPLQPQSGRPGG
eukprot:768719-Hanusia_phi.AAC.4